MTVLIIIGLWLIGLVFALILVGGVRRADELQPRSLRSMRNPTGELAEMPRSEGYSSPWSKPPKTPGPAASEARGRSVVNS